MTYQHMQFSSDRRRLFLDALRKFAHHCSANGECGVVITMSRQRFNWVRRHSMSTRAPMRGDVFDVQFVYSTCLVRPLDGC